MQKPKKKIRLKPWQIDEYIAVQEMEMQARARAGLLAFTLYTKEDYEVSWHHGELCKILNRFARGEIKRLIISLPPRHGKSELVSRRLPALLLGQNPDTQIISASYGADLASRMNRDVQRIMESPEYKRLFPDTKLGEGTAIKNSDLFEIVGRRGIYRSAGVGGAITGMGANFAIIDDPIKNQEEAMSQTYREKVWEWYGSTLYTRLEKAGAILITMTRWHEDDLVGRLLSEQKTNPEADKWEVFEFPAIKEDETNKRDPRAVGEALWPEKYDLKRLQGIRGSVGSRWFNALYQQRPSAPEGGLVKRNWLEFYTVAPGRFDEFIQSWDCTFKETKTSDFVVGQVWGRNGADCYLLAQTRARLDIVGTIQAITQMSAAYPKAYAKLIEDKANGPAVISMLKSKIGGLVAVEPNGSKEARLSAVAPMFEAGNVYLPDPSIAPWIREYVEELVSFPTAANDDQVDATTQALVRLRQSDLSFPKELVNNTIMGIASPLKGNNGW